MKNLAICIPTYNEKENIKNLIIFLRKILNKPDLKTKLIIIDDNSPDGTGKIADSLSKTTRKRNFEIIVIHNKKKSGLANAYKKGLKIALCEGSDLILTMDADFSHHPIFIRKFLGAINNNDLIIGSRYVARGRTQNWSFGRSLISKIGNFYSRLILDKRIKDYTGGFNLLKRQVVEKIPFEKFISKGYSFNIELKYQVAKSGFKFKEIPIIFNNRKKGKTKMNFKIFFEAFLRVIQFRFIKY